jgi:hypothetical protein
LTHEFFQQFLSGIGWRKHFYHPWFLAGFRHPLRTMGLKYYKGAPKPGTELLDGRSPGCAWNFRPPIVWEVFLRTITVRSESRASCLRVDIGAQIGLFS